VTEDISVARLYCPGCEVADPLTEILDVHWCDAHRPSDRGVEDDGVFLLMPLSGSAEAGGEENRRWCALFAKK
jgi:hypothetical protein